MIRSDRRTLLKGGAALAALGSMPAGLRAQSHLPAIFIYDARFAASRAIAEQWQQQGVAILDPRDHDLGLAWRGHIPRLLEKGGGIEGASLWSDRFVCETMGKQHGLSPAVAATKLPGPPDGALQLWIMA